MKLKIISVLVIILFISSSFIVTSISQDDNTDTQTYAMLDGPMDSPWPMFGQNPQRTGLSPYGISGNSSIVKWKFLINDLITSSPAIDNNDIIYIGGGVSDKSLFAVYPNGTQKWCFETNGKIQSSPAIAEDGTIYVGSNDGKLWAIYPNGTEKWRLNLGEGWVTSSPVIDTNGIIYAASLDSQKIYAIFPNSTIKWYFLTNDDIYSSPVLDNEGNIYIGSYDNYMYSLYPNGTLRWKFDVDSHCGGEGATISEDGSIYFGSTDNNLFALNNNGSLKWKFKANDDVYSSPAIGLNGNIYFGSHDGFFYCLNQEGSELWKYNCRNPISCSPSIDKHGVIYFGDLDKNFYAINPNGSFKWIFNTDHAIFSSPAIDKEGDLYFGSWDGYLYALEISDNHPPNTPTINGPTSGKIRTSYEYVFSTYDEDGDEVYYWIDWGDNTNIEWMGRYNSGDKITISHSWEEQKTYDITVKAKDEYGAESDWATLEVTMPRNKVLIDLMLDRFPIFRFLFLGF